MRTAKPGAIFMMSVMALAVIGAGYAAWYDSVRIEATVHMGELIVGWYNTTPYIMTVEETTNGFPEDEGGHGFVPKPWVANTTVTLSTPRTSVHHVPVETVYYNMTILVDNAYPQYDAHIHAWLKNAGTIPAYVCPNYLMEFWDAKDGEDLMYVWNDTAKRGEVWDDGLLDNGFEMPLGSGDDYIVFYFTIDEDVTGAQIHQCTAHPFNITIDFTQEAEECHTYLFNVTILAIQWNKDFECGTYLPIP